MSLYSDKDYSTSFRSRDGVERTRAAGERFLSHRGSGMTCYNPYQSTKT